MTAEDPGTARFFEQLQTSLAEQSFIKLLLSNPQAAAAGVQRTTLRVLSMKGQLVWSFVHSHATRDVTQNLPPAQGLALLKTLLGSAFKSAHLHTRGQALQLNISKRGKWLMSTVAVAAQAAALPSHDRPKQRSIDQQRPFLTALGVTTAQHQLVPAMARKWRQINKFIEVFAGALDSSTLKGAQRIRVADFGSGKGYLTFALHDWLAHTRGLQTLVRGVELRADMVALCQRVVADLGLQGLAFEEGDVRQQVNLDPAQKLDVMVALHACDEATDHAIHLGLRAGAQIIMCSPCCHQQIRPQLMKPQPMRALLQHGVHIDQQAEMVTDSLRALLLEAAGYSTQVFEFVALEHTQQNKMILAVKRAGAPAAPDAALAQIQALKQFFGIREQRLESLLAADLSTSTGP
jgi:SAM-dependent methyltransferase